jgi:DNA polymerase-3 subunit alpha
MSAMMTNDLADTAKLGLFIAEARAMGIEVLPPDVNESGVYFAPAGTGAGPVAPADRTAATPSPGTPIRRGAIRFGLAAIKGIGEVAVESLLKARTEGGRFQSLAELCERVDARTVNRKVLEALVKCGACDSLGETRATLFGSIERALARAASLAADRQRGQVSLFGLLQDAGSGQADPVARVPEWPQHQLLAYEKELLGFYVTGHPLTPYVPLLERYALSNTATLDEVQPRNLTRIGGLIAAVQNGVSRKSGKPYSIVTLEDLQGSVQVLCLNENYEKYRSLLVPNTAILVIGEVNLGDEKPKVFPQEILPLDDAPRRFTKQVHLRLHTAHLTAAHLEQAQALAAAFPGKCPLFLCLKRAGGEVIFIEAHERWAVAPSGGLQAAVDEAFGEGTYYAKVDVSLPERAPRRWERRTEQAEAP